MRAVPEGCGVDVIELGQLLDPGVTVLIPPHGDAGLLPAMKRPPGHRRLQPSAYLLEPQP